MHYAALERTLKGYITDTQQVDALWQKMDPHGTHNTVRIRIVCFICAWAAIPVFEVVYRRAGYAPF